jgi:hypothetical protein
MTNQFSILSNGNDGATIFFTGSQGPRIISESHLNFGKIKDALLRTLDTSQAGYVLEEDDLYRLADAAAQVTGTLERLSERVTIKGDTIYFDGDPMENRLTRHIVDMIRADDENYQGFVNFLENVQLNPSKASRKALFKFLDKHDLVITPDGCFIGYKGVTAEGKSLRAGAEEVTVTLADGTVEVHKGYIPYPVGATVEMPRSLVDPDRDTACSVGLHVGTHSYAAGYSHEGFLTVKVSPRDVVAVPSDSNDQKIRAHRLTVLEVNTERTRYEGTSFTVQPDDLVPADEEDFEEDDYDSDYDNYDESGNYIGLDEDDEGVYAY